MKFLNIFKMKYAPSFEDRGDRKSFAMIYGENMNIDMIGYRTERLEVIEYAGRKNGKSLWKCQCSCGNVCYHTTTELRVRKPSSCGCLQKETAKTLAPAAGKNRTLENGSCLNSYDAKLYTQNTSGVTGVSFFKKSNKCLRVKSSLI